MRLKPIPLPAPKECPVCKHGWTNRASIEAHNLSCSQTGERAYPERNP